MYMKLIMLVFQIVDVYRYVFDRIYYFSNPSE